MKAHESLRLKVVSAERKIEVFREGRPEPLLIQHADVDKRPYIHPIIAPDGLGVLTENMPSHHPWQHGLYVGLNNINGFGFWEEGIRNNPSDGTFHPRPLAPAQVSDEAASWKVETEWRAPDQSPLILEEQEWRFSDHESVYVLDLSWSLKALVELSFGQSDYGGLFLRMPFRKQWGGYALNSEGQRNQEAEGKRARWNAISMPIAERQGEWAGIAIMDHNENPEHPVPWRVDRMLGIAPSRCIAGDWSLAQGEKVRFLHRVVVFNGEPVTEELEHYWHLFVNNE